MSQQNIHKSNQPRNRCHFKWCDFGRSLSPSALFSTWTWHCNSHFRHCWWPAMVFDWQLWLQFATCKRGKQWLSEEIGGGWIFWVVLHPTQQKWTRGPWVCVCVCVCHGIQRFKCTTRLAVNIQTSAMNVVFVVCVCHLIHCRWDCDSLSEVNHTIQSFGLALYRFHWRYQTQLAQRYPSKGMKVSSDAILPHFRSCHYKLQVNNISYLSTRARHTNSVLYMQSLNRGTIISYLGKGKSASVPWNVYINLFIVSFLWINISI